MADEPRAPVCGYCYDDAEDGSYAVDHVVFIQLLSFSGYAVFQFMRCLCAGLAAPE
jgi:hypothetical protein